LPWCFSAGMTQRVMELAISFVIGLLGGMVYLGLCVVVMWFSPKLPKTNIRVLAAWPFIVGGGWLSMMVAKYVLLEAGIYSLENGQTAVVGILVDAIVALWLALRSRFWEK
jgi:hypothetical protein